jgi:hypothetical protein
VSALDDARRALAAHRATATGHRFTLRHEARPWTTNAERRLSPFERARHVREWRRAFATLAREAGIPPLERVRVMVIPHTATARNLADTGGHYPAAKAALDGLVDAGILPDDSGRHVPEIVLCAPRITGADALELVLVDLDDPTGTTP